MTDDPKPSRGMPRSLIYVLIPLGFVLIIGFLMLGGATVDELEDQGETPDVLQTEPAEN